MSSITGKCLNGLSTVLKVSQLFEVIAKEVPLSFTELNESRLCELLVYILNRVTVGQDSLKFDTVIKGCKYSNVPYSQLINAY